MRSPRADAGAALLAALLAVPARSLPAAPATTPVLSSAPVAPQGGSWLRYPLPGAEVKSLAAEPRTPGLFYAGTALGGTAAWSAEPVETLAEGVGAERWLSPGEARIFRFTLASKGRVGLGLREEAESLACAVSDEAGRTLGEGCQQLLTLEAGRYVLAVRAPPGAPASRFKPVLLGLAGSETGVPEEYLRDFFQRIGGSN